MNGPCGFTFVLVYLPRCQGMARTVVLVFPVHIYFLLNVTDHNVECTNCS